jgi:hypothetical protein
MHYWSLNPIFLHPIDMNALFIRAAAAPDKLMILEKHTSDYRLGTAADDTWHEQPHD